MAAATAVTFTVSTAASAIAMFMTATAASAFAMLVVTAMASAAATVATAFFTVTAVATAIAVDEFSMETFFQLFVRRFTYTQDFTGEIQSLSGHRMVEVHLHGFFFHFKDEARNHSAAGCHHRNGFSGDEQILANLSVHFESGFRQVDDAVLFDFAVTLFRCQRKCEFVARLESFDVVLEFAEKGTYALDEVQWFLFGGMVNDLTIYVEVIDELNNCMCCDFHMF